MWDEITYPFQNFNECTALILEWISSFILHSNGDGVTYPYRDNKCVLNSICSNSNWILLFYTKEISLDHSVLTHWGRVTHRCVIKLTITGSNNGLSPDGRQAIIWTIAGIPTVSFKKVTFKVSSAKYRPFRLGLNVISKYQYKHVASWYSFQWLLIVIC